MVNGQSSRRRKRKKPDPLRPVFPPCPQWPRDEVVLAAEADWSFQLLLWQRARDVVLWANTPLPNRAGLFATPVAEWQVRMEDAATEEEALSPPLRVLAAMVRYPEVMKEPDICSACLTISEWAASNHLPETAMRFAEAAGNADRMNARAAADAGQLAAQQSADDRAEVWYERGIKIGRRTEDWEWHIRSNLRMGILRYEQGNFRAARRCYERARECAEWIGLLPFAGKAHHDMLRLAIAGGSFALGDRYARKALENYPVHYERLPYLAHDYAVLLTTHRRDADALTLLAALLPMISLPEERLTVLGTFAKASAGVGNRSDFREAAEDALVLAGVSDVTAAGALALAAEGAVVLRDWRQAELLAAKAVEVATRRREREPRRRAELALRAVATRTVPPRPRVHPDEEMVGETVAMFLSRLHNLGAQTTDAGAHSRGRAELTKFSIAGR